MLGILAKKSKPTNAPLNSNITVIRPVEATDVAAPTITATSTILLTSRMRASMV